MLSNLKELLTYAEENNCAIPAFNYTSLEVITSVIKAAEDLDYPVILSFAPVHEIFYKIDTIFPIAKMLAQKSKAKICLHYDHGTDLNKVKEAIDMGFTSVMYDGSSLNFEENLANTIEIVKYAKPKNVSVEAELGRIKSYGLEGDGDTTSFYTDPEAAREFVLKSKVDCLAISFGTVHGEYQSEPDLNFPLIKKVREITNNIPIVMHGGSGVSKNDYIRCINSGVRKINYYTYMQREGYKRVSDLIKSNESSYYHDIVLKGKEAFYDEAVKVINTFKNK